MKTCFHSDFYANFHASVNFAIFVLIFMKFSPKCRTNKFDIHHFAKFSLIFFIGKGPKFGLGPNSGLGKSMDC